LSEKLKDNPNKPSVITKEIVFELPDNWEKEYLNELNKFKPTEVSNPKKSNGCLTAVIIIIVIIFLLSLIK